MCFQVADRVVHPAYGVGRVVGLVTRRSSEAEACLYYEVAIDRTTVWVPVETSATSGLRPLASQTELADGRDILRSSPQPLLADHRQRRVDLLGRLKTGAFQDLCQMVRDLSARGWSKPLGEADSMALRKARERLCQEWAAVKDMPVPAAAAEVSALLLEARQAFQAPR